MKLKASVFAVIATHPHGRTERLADFDTREEAEDRAEAEGQYAAGPETTFAVLLLDRRKPAPRPMPQGLECFLKGATPAERERCLAIYS